MRNILSLFDGMSCFQLALQRLGVTYKNYYASEIDKYAIRATRQYFPETIQLGDVTRLSADILPEIDFLVGGSPCQGFSVAGKGLNFEDPRSKLFFEFVRLRNELQKRNPKLKWLLENVCMKKEHEVRISRLLGCNPILINSALVSAQNRERLYWTNIGSRPDGFFDDMITDIPQPKDKGILLKDILEENVAEKYYLSEKALSRINRSTRRKPRYNPDKSGCLTTKNNSGQLSVDSGTTLIGGTIDRNTFREVPDKSLNIDYNYFKGHDNHGARTVILTKVIHGLPRSGDKTKGGTGILTREDGKTYCLDSSPGTNNVGVKRLYDLNGGSQGNRIYSPEFKSTTINSAGGGQGGNSGLYEISDRIRRLTPLECCRLQTVPDNYFKLASHINISESQQYKMLGNGMTIDVLCHILSFM